MCKIISPQSQSDGYQKYKFLVSFKFHQLNFTTQCMILLYPNTHDIGEYSSTIIDNQKNTFSIISKIHQLDFTFKTLFSLHTQYYQ